MMECQKLNYTPTRVARMYLLSLFVLLIPASFADDNTPLYQGCSIIGFAPVSSEALFQELDDIPSLDFFKGPSTKSASEVMACGEEKEKLLQALASHKIRPEILVEDISKMGRSRDHFADIPRGTMDWVDYHGLENIYTWLDKVVKDFPKLISMEVIGKTFENREIRAYKIEKTNGSKSLNATYLECLIHGREWSISGACTYIINELTAYSSKYSELLNVTRFYIVPVVNPDGFTYSNGTGKFVWRKNRRKIPENEQSNCANPSNPATENIGVDLNRNWPFEWQQGNNPCSQSYSGVKGYVEAEIKAVTEFLLSHDDIDTFIDIHCYSQWVLLPWAYKKDRVPNYDEILNLGKIAVEAAKSVSGTIYIPGQISELIRNVGGSSVDWAYEVRKIKYSFGLELRPMNGTNSSTYGYGFHVPLNQILPTVKEAWILVQVLALKRKPDYLSFGARPEVCIVLLAALLAFSYTTMGYRVRRLSILS